ncbi:MAG TPA: phage tail protein [Kofleriaceae bacterium]|nr:phage tail protein [Kofleriaceae bacterium]
MDPLAGFCFKVTFNELPKIVGTEIVETYFRSVSGLRAENEVVPLRAGGANDTIFNLVGGVKWSALVLKQGFTKGSGLLKWREMWTSDAKKQRSGGTIQQLDSTLKVVQAEWTFVRGWPSKWELTEFDASKSELSIETLEICHEGLKYSAK